MNKSTTDLWVIAAQQGNTKAFAKLYEKYNPALLRYVYKLSGNSELTKDVCQCVWLELARKLHRLVDPRAFKSWLYRTARWRCLDELRTLSKHSEYVLEESIDSTHTIEMNSDIFRAMQKLAKKEYEVVYLFYLEDLSVKEIAHVIQIPIGTVKSRLSKARESLNSLLS